MTSGPLSGITVLEFSQIISAPICGLTLSDLGADVVKIEPPGGDQTRQTGSVVPGESKGFQTFNRGKRSVVVDLQHPEGVSVIHHLVRNADVVITNYRLGVPERIGIDYDTLSSIRPDLIYWHGTAFGETGPEAHRAGSDLVAQAYTGLLAADEKVDEWGAPVRITSAPFADYMTGVAAALGICAAIYHRALTGQGQRVGASLLQSALFMQMPYVAREPITDATSRDLMLEELAQSRQAGATYQEMLDVRSRYGRFGGAFSIFYGGYQAGDGAFVLGALTRANRDGARRVLAIEDEPSDRPEYDANEQGAAAEVERWKAVVRERVRGRTVAEWLADFDREGVPASAVRVPEELSDDPQVQAMNLMVPLDHELTGPQRLVGPLVNLSVSPTAAHGASPPLARHTEEVLTEQGMSRERISELRESGAIA